MEAPASRKETPPMTVPVCQVTHRHTRRTMVVNFFSLDICSCIWLPQQQSTHLFYYYISWPKNQSAVVVKSHWVECVSMVTRLPSPLSLPAFTGRMQSHRRFLLIITSKPPQHQKHTHAHKPIDIHTLFMRSHTKIFCFSAKYSWFVWHLHCVGTQCRWSVV